MLHVSVDIVFFRGVLGNLLRIKRSFSDTHDYTLVLPYCDKMLGQIKVVVMSIIPMVRELDAGTMDLY